MLNNLLLLSGNDIPFVEAQTIIHQPRIKEIAYIGQDNFYTGCSYLTFSKENLEEEDKSHLEKFNDFEVLMIVIKEKDNASIQKIRTCMKLVLLLLFPDYRVDFLPSSIMLSKNIQGTKQNYLIDKDNFQSFKQILQKMFCLSNILNSSDKYNPKGPQAKALVQKFKKRQQKLAELKNKGKKKKQVSFLSRYISILAVGEKKDLNELFQYTVYQLVDEFRRFQLREDYDVYIRFKAAGAKDMEQIKNWMDDIHSDTFKEDII